MHRNESMEVYVTDTSGSAPEADQIFSLLGDVSKKIAALPADQQAPLHAALRQIEECVHHLAAREAQHHHPQTPEIPAARLSTSDARYRELAEAITDPFAVYDADLRLLYRNKASALVTRIPDDQAVGRTFCELYPDMVGSEAHQVYLRALETRTPQRHLSHWTRPYDGQDFYYDLSVYPTSDGIIAFSKDVTEQKKVEEALKESQKKFARAFHSSPVAQIMLREADRRMIDVNDAFLELFGYTREEVIGRTSIELGLYQNPDDHQILILSRSQERIYKQEIKVRTKTGAARTLLLSQEHIELNGEDCLLVTAIDITERVQAEAALQERNTELMTERSRLLAVMDALPVAVAILDEKGGQVQVNAAYDALWGSLRPEVATVEEYEAYQAWWADTGQLVRPEEWASARAVQNGETVIGQFLKIQKFGGEQAYVLNSGAPIRDAGGAVIGSAVAIMDVSKMIETEKALQETQHRFQVALKSVPIMVYTCDRERRFTWVYQPVRGFTPEEMIGKRDDELLPPGAAVELVAVKQHALDTGQGGIHLVKVPEGDDYLYYILTIEPMRDAQGSVTGLTCSSMNITAQRHLEKELQEQAIQIEVQRRLMEQREQDRYALARDLHDGPIQTLSSTSFHLQMIRESFPDRTLLAELDQIGLDVKSTIRELREVMNELRPPALLHFGIVKVIQLHAQDLHAKFPNIAIQLEITGDDKCLSKQAHLALYRIYQEATNNIVRHACASKIWVVLRTGPGGFHFELRDNGAGFANNQDYSQLTREGHFGLVGMIERAEAIGAVLTVTSEPGGGTTIVVKGPVEGK